ncbi:MAG TPA: hypothetical protein VHA75_15760, partial [Rugosimonospora sp.]|nr:hypothetical protein [Rugosimonospora sp.]
MTTGMREGAPTSRTRRSHPNEGRHLPGPKPIAGRFGPGGRPGIPVQVPEPPGNPRGAGTGKG